MIKKNINYKAGMTYIELIVVLSIFAGMSAIIAFNYGQFQGKIDVKNLASDVALKIVQAQKEAISGKLPPPAQQAAISNPSTWKPSYGVYMDPVVNNKSFIYYVDLNRNDLIDPQHIANCSDSIECLEKFSLTGGTIVTALDAFAPGDPSPHSLVDLFVTFTRPNTSPVIRSSIILPPVVSYIQITMRSPKGVNSYIKIYPSGRIQIN